MTIWDSISDIKCMSVRYEHTYPDICCGTGTDIYNSLEDVAIEFGSFCGEVRVQKLWECGHWAYTGEVYKIHHIELYELAEYLQDWGVDTLDSDRFIVFTDGECDPIMLMILEAKS